MLGKKFNKRSFVLLVYLVVLGLLFRIYRLPDFQYWSDDEQLLWYTVRHIVVDRHFSLVAVNTALGVGLSSLYHYMLAPWFILFRFNPVLVSLLGLVFFVFNIIFLFFAGRDIFNERVGYIASLLYAFSFTASLFDRRLWALSPNFLVVVLAFYSLAKLISREYKYVFLLIPGLIMPFVSDPSLGIVLPVVLASFLIFRIKIPTRHAILTLGISAALLSPLFIFELRHNFQNTRSLMHALTNEYSSEIRLDVSQRNFFISQLENFSRYFYIQPSSSIESVFCYCFLDDKETYSFAVLVFLALFVLITIKTRNKNYFVLLLFLFSYLFGKYLFQQFFKGMPSFFYSQVVMPIVFLMAAILLANLKKIFLIPILFLFLFLNSYVFLKSSFKYPLINRMRLVSQIQDYMKRRGIADYSLYYSGDILVSGGGWTSLFHSLGNYPSRGSMSLYWGHAYESYKLYPIEFSKKDPSVVVVISESHDLGQKERVLEFFGEEGLYGYIYDNSSYWFNPEVHLEKLYQPPYFE